MITTLVKRAELPAFGLKDDAPVKLDKPYELVFNEDDNRYELYKVSHKGAVESDDVLMWQVSCPVTGPMITPGIKDWIRRYDTTQGGTLDEDQRIKRWCDMYKYVQTKNEKFIHNIREEVKYELTHRTNYLRRLLEGQRQCVVPAGPPVGRTKQGKLIRAYKKIGGTASGRS